MGWLFYSDRRVSTYADEKAEIARICTFETDTRCTKLLKCCKVGSTWYAAVCTTPHDGKPIANASHVLDADGSFVFGVVFLTKYDDGCWGYKDIEETGGPAESKAPLHLINILSELAEEDSHAHDWRKRCRDWANIPTYKEGDIIKLARVVNLTDGSSCETVEATHYLRRGRKMRCYRPVGSQTLVRLSKGCLSGSVLVKTTAEKASPVLAEFYNGGR